MGAIYLGTSGFSYDDWIGHFYPADMVKANMLPFYGRRFRCVEINATYYTPPSERMIQSFIARTPPEFQFVIKGHKQITHEPASDEAEAGSIFEAFRTSLAPLADAGKLGCILLQFPYSFRPAPANVSYLEEVVERMGWAPLTVEFRNSHWVDERTFDLLRRLGVAFCCVDEPRLSGLMPPVAVATAPLAYVRFHGRNAAKWWEHEQAYERYDYLYSEDELREWTDKIRALADSAEKTFVFFNNHYRGQAAINAEQLIQLLSEGQ